MGHDWYLPILIWFLAIAFIGFLVFTLWTGKFYARGPVYGRRERPSEYWTGVVFLALASSLLTYVAITDFR